jgi:hypothetical protein
MDVFPYIANETFGYGRDISFFSHVNLNTVVYFIVRFNRSSLTCCSCFEATIVITMKFARAQILVVKWEY